MRADVVVIGGGPAGMSAAIAAKEAGAEEVVIIEREPRLSGILQQCIHNGFGLHKFKEELTGPEYGQRYEEMVSRLGITVFTDTMAVDITPERVVTAVNKERGYFAINAGAVVLAMGCREKSRGALSIPGTRPA
ncbi:MAG: NAD(P)/FAD-dependent oxidoreductase, partial [Firmicutes bacterium]|nr:NAD(P)/FAD-dependent oxidoreductase [Bacillota bacterium]